MSVAVLFSGSQPLDFFEVRSNLVRIPEVRARIEEAQRIWDEEVPQAVDFHQFLCSDNSYFFSNLSLRSLCSAIVQLGLYDRLKRSGREGDFLVGDGRNDSALKVAVGLMSFYDLIVSSRAAGIVQPLRPIGGLPQLNGQTFANYEVFKKQIFESGIQYVPVNLTGMDLSALMRALQEKHQVSEVVTVGPGQVNMKSNQDANLIDLRFSESIDIDPLLTWFWRDIRETQGVAL